MTQRRRHRMGEARASQGGGVPPAGTIGGKPQGLGLRPGQRMPAIGDAGYLWALVALELAAISGLRQYFRRYHGG